MTLGITYGQFVVGVTEVVDVVVTGTIGCALVTGVALEEFGVAVGAIGAPCNAGCPEDWAFGISLAPDVVEGEGTVATCLAEDVEVLVVADVAAVDAIDW